MTPQPALNFTGLWLDNAKCLIRVTHWDTDHWVGVQCATGDLKAYDSDGLCIGDNTKLEVRRRGGENL